MPHLNPCPTCGGPREWIRTPSTVYGEDYFYGHPSGHPHGHGTGHRKKAHNYGHGHGGHGKAPAASMEGGRVNVPAPIGWIYDDGGRAKAGFRGESGDCVTRAVAIATGKPYREIYDMFHEAHRSYATAHHDRTARAIERRGASPRNGVARKVTREHLAKLGWEWTPTMGIGTGCQVHLRADELPAGPVIVQVSKHVCAVIDGVVRDTHDPSRGGTRCVYGYWQLG